MRGRYGSINTSMSIPTFHAAGIRIQGLALNSAKTGSKNSAMCRSLRTDDKEIKPVLQSQNQLVRANNITVTLRIERSLCEGIVDFSLSASHQKGTLK